MSSSQLANKEYEIVDNIDSGASGIVSKIKTKTGVEQIFALKQVILRKNEEDGSDLKEAELEYKFLQIEKKNVVQSHGCYYSKENNQFLFTMDYHPQNLEHYIEKLYQKKGKNILFKDVEVILEDIFTGK